MSLIKRKVITIASHVSTYLGYKSLNIPNNLTQQKNIKIHACTSRYLDLDILHEL